MGEVFDGVHTKIMGVIVYVGQMSQAKDVGCFLM